MPRYYFHFVSKDEFIPDYDGVVLEDLKVAHGHAMRLILQTVRAMPSEDFRHWHVEVADESQFVALTVLFPAPPPVAGSPFGRRGDSPLDTVVVRPKGPGPNAEPSFRPSGGEGHYP
jgi:hypothetical protein